MSKIKLSISEDPNEVIYFQPVETSHECEVGISDWICDGFESVLSNITKFATNIQDKMKEVNSPDKVSVELSFGLSTEAGKVVAVLVNSQATAGIKIKLDWEREKEV